MARLAERGRSHESIGSPLGLTRQRVRARDQQVILHDASLYVGVGAVILWISLSVTPSA